MKTTGDLDDIESFFAEDMPKKPELLKQLKALKYLEDIESDDPVLARAIPDST